MNEPRVTIVLVIRALTATGLAGLVAGALLTVRAVDDHQVAYLALTAAGVAALVWLLRDPPDGPEGTVVAVLLAIFLLAYFARYYTALRLRLDDRADLFAVLFGLDLAGRSLTPETALESYTVMIGALVALAVATALVGHRAPAADAWSGTAPASGDGRVGASERVLLGMAVALSLATAVAHYVLIGLERVAPDLPFRLAGILSIARNVLVPSLGLLVVWAAERAGDRRGARLGVLFLVAHGLTSAILTSSRGQLVSPLVSLALLWLVTGRFTRRRGWGLLLASPALALGFTVLGAYRNLARDDVAEIAAGIGEALGRLAADDSGLPFWVSIVLAVAGRLNGFDSLARIVAWQEGGDGAGMWGWLRPAEESVTTIFTRDIMNVPPEWATAVSPSLLGYFYFRTGSALVTSACVAAWTIGWCLLFRRLATEGIRATEVSFAVVGWTFVLLSNEGTLEGVPLFALAGGATLVMNHLVAGALEPAPAEA